MNRGSNSVYLERMLRRTAVVSSIGMSLLCASVAYGDSPSSMAPPVATPDQAASDSEQSSVDQTTVFNWTQVPENQQIDLKHADFDKGGYQLYDTAGDTIIVPFTNHNLYVMKFARSKNGAMYFVNDGKDPILYVPEGGYLENATVPGAKWYPISDNFQPTDPVYMGIAPSWDDYAFMGWYPDMVCNGGYYCDAAFGAFAPCSGFSFVIGVNTCFGWNRFCDFCIDFDPPCRTGFFFRDYYRHDFGFGRRFPDRVPHYSGSWVHNFGGDHNFGGGHGFGGDHNFGGGHNFGGNHNFGGSTGEFSGRTYDYGRGAQTFNSGRSFSGGERSFSGGSFGGGRSFQSGGRSFSGGSRSFGGGGGGRSFGAGGRSFGGGGGGRGRR